VDVQVDVHVDSSRSRGSPRPYRGLTTTGLWTGDAIYRPMRPDGFAGCPYDLAVVCPSAIDR
jgi:hypothetical protein